MENNAETRESVFNSPNLDGYYVTVDPDGLHPGTIDGDIILGLTDTDGADFVVRIDCRTAKQLSKSLKAAVTMSKLNNKINC